MKELDRYQFKDASSGLAKAERKLFVHNKQKSLVVIRNDLETFRYPEIVGLKLEQINPFVKAVDLRSIFEEHHPYWRGELLEVAKQAKEKEIIGGSIYTSLVPSDFVTYYQPTNATVIKEALPWWYEFFTKELRFLVERATGDPTVYLGKGPSAFNINYTQEGPYELHYDRNDDTAVIAVEDVEENVGGILRIHERFDYLRRIPVGRSFDIRPKAGFGYIFNGRIRPHEVTPYRGRTPRTVIPVDFHNENRPEVLEDEVDRGVGVSDAA